MSHGRWLARTLLVVTAMAGVFVAGATPAFAHAEVERTNPVANSVVESPPRQITLTFDEGVFPAHDAIRLYDDRLAPVGLGETFHPRGVGKLVAARVQERLDTGTYTVVWRVTSDDAHVVAGQFTFSVGHATAVSGIAPGTKHNSTTSLLSALARGLGYLGLLLGPGALVVMVWLWPAGFARRRVRLMVYGGGLLVVLAAGLAVWVQGAAAAGVSVGHALDGADLRLGMAGHFGRAVAGRVVLLVALLWFALAGMQGRGRVPAVRTTAVAFLLAATWPYAGHAAAGDLVPLAFIADWVHVSAMATWLGGLAVLLVGPLRDTTGPDPSPESFPMLEAFSEWALNAVTLIVATGLFAAWRNVRIVGALTGTHYGRLLIWKTAAVVLVVAVARLSRRYAEGLDRRAGAPLPVLRRSVVAEAAGAVAILAITAFLTGTAQASQSYGPAFTRSAVHDGVTVTVHVDRTHLGVAHLVVSTTRHGRVEPIESIEGSLSEAAPPVGPLPLVFHAAGSGRETATFTFPGVGDWSLNLGVGTESGQQIAVATNIHVRG
ncbi:MAG TPA: copper resistance protein CopC [Mycobacteriales bacterium]|nr:copper resistance protein CopC [Mycobacteriales bacterium]